MGNSELDYILNSYVGLPHSFTVEEALDFIDKNISLESLREAFLNDQRFICLSTELLNELRFISKDILFHWFFNLNIRFSEARLFKLTKAQFNLKINQLRCEGQWDSPPIEAIKWGQSFGLISPCCTTEQYVFPLAWVLSSLGLSANASFRYFSELGDKEISKAILKTALDGSIEQIFSKGDKKVVDIVRHRMGFFGSKKITLEELAKRLGMTRERIRQIEEKFINQKIISFLKVFLYEFMCESGSLVVSIDSSRMLIRESFAKCSGIAPTRLSKIGISILADLPNFSRLFKKSSKLWREQIEADAMAKYLESDGNFFLISEDIKIISEKMAQWFRKHLDVDKKAYLVLRSIGEPSHYSKVTEIYNELFPDSPSTEHSVHSMLCRQKHGIVWIGIRGTFALKEWGFKRPTKTLFNTVTDVVNKIYRETGKPVSYAVILAELGKHRKLLNPSSLVFVTQFNPDVECISKDLFVPRRRQVATKDETSNNKLDKVLRKFQ